MKVFSFVHKMTDCKQLRYISHTVEACRAHPFPFQIVLILFYRLSLDMLYLNIISPIFAYADFITNLMPLNYICTWLMVFILAPLILRINEENHASSVIITFLNYFYFIPMSSYCGCKGTNVYFLLVFAAYWAILLVLQHKISVLALKPVSSRHAVKIYPFLTIVSAVFVLFISWKYTGFRITLDFFNVYGIRAEAAEYDIPVLATYILSAMNIVMPVLLLYWLYRRRYVLSILLCFILIVLFSIAGHKSIFFLFLASLACFFLFRPWMLRWMSGLLTLFAGVAALEYKLVGTYYIMTLFFRRMMFLPAQLSEKYAIFFQENPINLFRDGFMSKLSFDNIYSTSIPYVLGEFGGHPKSSANNGMLGDLFANLPVLLGLLLLPLILVLCFRLLDMAAEGIELKILLPICLYSATTFMNSSWSVVLLSHGFLLMCLLMYVFPKAKERLHEGD